MEMFNVVFQPIKDGKNNLIINITHPHCPPYALPTSFEALTNLKKHGKMPIFLRVENGKKGISEIIGMVQKRY